MTAAREFTPEEFARYRFAVVSHGAVRARCETREEAESLTVLMGCICHGAASVVDAPHTLAATSCNACDALSPFAATNAAGYCEDCLAEVTA